MKTVVINAGHGGADPGATFNGREEKNDALRMALAIGVVLKENGVNVVQTRTTDVFVSLSEVCDIEKEAHADLFCSIHRNANKPEKAKGVETYSLTTTGDGRKLANEIQNNLVNVGVTANRGIKTANYYVLKNTNAPAVLVELGFVDNTEDNKMFDTKFNEYAVAIAKAILHKLGMQYNGNLSGNKLNINPINDFKMGIITASILNVRSGPGSNYPIIGQLKNSQQVKLHTKVGNWWSIYFGDHGGFISADYVQC